MHVYNTLGTNQGAETQIHVLEACPACQKLLLLCERNAFDTANGVGFLFKWQQMRTAVEEMMVIGNKKIHVSKLQQVYCPI